MGILRQKNFKINNKGRGILLYFFTTFGNLPKPPEFYFLECTKNREKFERAIG